MISSELVLPNGVVLRNRIVKAATSEYLADPSDNKCNERLCQLYRNWAETDASVLITGNIMVTREFMEAPTNVAVELRDLGDPMLSQWVRSCGRSLLIAQISHCGRQCPISVSFHPVAPSAVALKLFPSAFVKPRALETHEVTQVVGQFADTAFVLWRAGFAGVQLHAAHGYLLSTFLVRVRVELGVCF
jgi:2,4-dienoyl-CoA reductase-like NADH-dependent reductase (Old Yellow Enzyme family)